MQASPLDHHTEKILASLSGKLQTMPAQTINKQLHRILFPPSI